MKTPLYRRVNNYLRWCELIGKTPERILIHPDDQHEAWTLIPLNLPIKLLGEDLEATWLFPLY